MPDRALHENFDKYLAERGVLLLDGRYGQVHTFMDLGVRTYGPKHQEEDDYHQEEGLRSWINGKYNVIGQDRATDWLRAGLGHICLDEANRRVPDSESWITLFDSAYRSMVQRGWNRAKFQHR